MMATKRNFRDLVAYLCKLWFTGSHYREFKGQSFTMAQKRYTNLGSLSKLSLGRFEKVTVCYLTHS